MARVHGAIAAVALALALTAATTVEWTARQVDVGARFAFDDIAYDIPATDPALGGSVTPAELSTVMSVARSELALAFSGLRIAFVDHPRAAFQVRVVRDLPPRPGPRPLAAAESVALGPLGGLGWVSFKTIASLATRHAPADATRSDILQGIGRGIGRVAAHEFAHQILAGTNLHASADPLSYEYRSADRAAQFYSPMHWAFASPLLADQIGVRD